MSEAQSIIISIDILRYVDKIDNCRVDLKKYFPSNFGTNVQLPEQIMQSNY